MAVMESSTGLHDTAKKKITTSQSTKDSPIWKIKRHSTHPTTFPHEIVQYQINMEGSRQKQRRNSTHGVTTV